MLHECFRSAAVGQISKKATYPKLACPVKLADTSAAADPASREAALRNAVEERNKVWWADMHGMMLFALVIRHQGQSRDTDEFVEGLQNLDAGIRDPLLCKQGSGCPASEFRSDRARRPPGKHQPAGCKAVLRS